MITRRRFLSLSLAAAAGRLLTARPLLATTKVPTRHLVMVYLAGGPSQIDTFDPKPGTKNGGAFRAIATKVPDLKFSEHLPLLAERADRLAVVRSLTSTEGSHARARYLLHTAYPPNPSVRHASLGSALAHELSAPELPLPAYVALGGPGEGAGFLGAGHAPFVVRSPPGKPIENLKSPPEIDDRRLDARMDLVGLFDGTFARAGGDAEVRARRAMMERARTMMRASAVRAFDIDGEPASVRRAYGDTAFGGRCLTARRLIEEGVRAVEIELPGWDTHEDNFERHQKLSAELDPALAALIDDLVERDLFDRTLIVVAGEFGRTPRINGKDGRDHHPRCFSAVLAGGGVRGGTVVGATTDDGTEVATRPVTIPDVFATAFRLLGVDGGKTFTSNDRPISLANSGKVIRELVG
jgi:uncharacterized protein (DUF1501 family)